MRKAVINAAVYALSALATASLIGPSALAQGKVAQDKIARGEYLVTIMDCAGCHTPGALRGQPDMARQLAGSDVGFQIPGLGIFYPPNLTSDRATGLGTWSEPDSCASRASSPPFEIATSVAPAASAPRAISTVSSVSPEYDSANARVRSFTNAGVR